MRNVQGTSALSEKEAPVEEIYLILMALNLKRRLVESFANNGVDV